MSTNDVALPALSLISILATRPTARQKNHRRLYHRAKNVAVNRPTVRVQSVLRHDPRLPLHVERRAAQRLATPGSSLSEA